MPTRYTITSGDQPKLLATTDETTRTVTSLRGLDNETSVALAKALGRIENDLVKYTAADGIAPKSLVNLDLVEALTTLGVRTGQLVTDDEQLTLSGLADLPAPAGESWKSARYAPVVDIGRVLHAASGLTDASARALRAELRSSLGAFDGPVVPVSVWMLDGPGTFNAATWATSGDRQQVGDLVFGAWPECAQAAEDIVWFYSAPGVAFEGLGNEIVAAEAEFNVTVSTYRVVDRLAATRPDLLTELVDEAISTEVDWDDEDAYARALTLLGR